MRARNYQKDLNFGIIMRNLRKKQIILPVLGSEATEACIEELDWYTYYLYSMFPSAPLEELRNKISEDIANRSFRIRDIKDLRLKKELENK